MRRYPVDTVMAAWISILAAILYLKYSNLLLSLQLYGIMVMSFILLTKSIGEYESGTQHAATIYIRYIFWIISISYFGTFILYSFKYVI